MGICGDRIVAIGALDDVQAQRTIDAQGQFVAPGFIDFHSHSDLSVVYDRHARSRIHSGVTTDVIANCGIGVAPVCPAHRQELIDYLSTRVIGTIPTQLELRWDTVQQYFDYLQAYAPAINIVSYVAQGPVRIHEMGFSRQPATPEQLGRMKAEVKRRWKPDAWRCPLA